MRGGLAAFKILATGTGTLSYQWEKETTAISGATNSIYILNNIDVTNEDYYNCVITNSCGATTSVNVILYVNTAPVLNISAIVQTVKIGDTIHFNISPTGAETFTYQWMDNSNIIAGATNKAYNIDGIKSSEGGLIHV